MVRAPCCVKMGLKKGPWTREEDHILIDYINQHGHSNWRALPKEAGLLRCGKSCRLRWTNYLRPDIKRGNFSKEEEETIISLHESLGNRWSTIAARLPGRTDNEIKNVWHTHLKKKRLNQIQIHSSTPQPKPKPKSIKSSKFDTEQKPINYPIQTSLKNPDYHLVNSPQISSSEVSSVTTAAAAAWKADELEDFPEMDENFWSEVWSAENSGATSNFPATDAGQHQSPVEYVYGYNNYSSMHDGMGYWHELFTSAGDSIDLPEYF